MRRAMPTTTWSTSTNPTEPPTSETSPACGSRRPTSCGPRRRRPTSTSSSGSSPSTWWSSARPGRLALTHFGAVEEPGPHLDQMRRRLAQMAELVRALLDEHGDTPEAVQAFVRGDAAPRRRSLAGRQRRDPRGGGADRADMGRNAPLLGQAGGGGGSRPVVNLAGIEQPRRNSVNGSRPTGRGNGSTS